MNVRLRFIEGTDTKRIVEWRNANAEFFPRQKPWTNESHMKWYARYLTDMNAFVYMVMLADKTPVGTIGIQWIPNSRHCEIGQVVLGVRDERTVGVMGEALKQVMYEQADTDLFLLKVLRNNHRARAFYRKHGFEVYNKDQEFDYMVRMADDPAL